MFDDADAAIAKITEDVRRAQERAERLPLLQATTEAARGSAISAQRDIAVTVDQTGQVTELRIDDRALDRGGSRLAADIVQLLARARDDVRVKLLTAAADVLGKDDPIVDSFRERVETAGSEPASDARTAGGLS
ncbi:YbaB/EbfC family nucleoid-associated protein [Leifsonia aquatica]|uniref:YbaB/EbfC family nucleoid-associated protein n=1 Tax=Leifsonia aquatica TaxID=144185 RepID=UPI0037FFF76B